MSDTKPMPIKEIALRLKYWKQRAENLDKQIDALTKLTGSAPDCDLLTPIYDLWDAYTVAVSELVGDKDEWLNWFQNECDMGRSPKSFLRNKQKITVRTLNQLARVIAA